jgi:hypothetical protein
MYLVTASAPFAGPISEWGAGVDLIEVVQELPKKKPTA